MVVGQRPHTPLYAPKRYFDLYEGVDIQLPPVPVREDIDDANDLADLSLVARGVAYATSSGGTHATTVKYGQWQSAVKAYLACIAFVDVQVSDVVFQVPTTHCSALQIQPATKDSNTLLSRRCQQPTGGSLARWA